MVNIYIDESGSVNRLNADKRYFVIALIVVKDAKKLKTVFKRFVRSNIKDLQRLDQQNVHGKHSMFLNGQFKELKGSCFDRNMKYKFAEFFTRNDYFDILYVKLDNLGISESLASNKARAFNYPLRLAIEHFIKNGLIPDEDIYLHLDERNERTETRHFLCEYLNTELSAAGRVNGSFMVKYYDSSNLRFIQIADVFSNLFYSHLHTGAYKKIFKMIKERGRLKYTFKFP